MTPLRLDAPAKLNLTLAVVGRRPDGFHELVSDMVLLELADRLLLMPGCSGLRVDGVAAADVPVEAAANLAWRGLRDGLEREPELMCLAIDKRVPVAAGLGGGSSDAAAAWRLGRRWTGNEETPTADELANLSRIGADVPFFASCLPAARVEGIGERVVAIPAPAPAAHVVLAHPPFALRTADVFAELRAADVSDSDANRGNDLLAPAGRLRPELDDVIRLVVAAGGDPRLSGSGPTIFSLTDDPERAAAVAARLERAGLRATVTRIRDEPARIETIEEVEE